MAPPSHDIQRPSAKRVNCYGSPDLWSSTPSVERPLLEFLGVANPIADLFEVFQGNMRILVATRFFDKPIYDVVEIL